MASKFSIETVFKGIDKITAPMAKISRESQKLGKRMEAAMRGPNKFADRSIQSFKKLGLAAAGAAASAGLVGRSIIGAGASFEQAITAVGAVGLQTRDQIRELEERALRLGSTTKFTATEAANAMEIMARAGFSNQEILAGVDGVLSAAAASGLEMAEVANHVSNVLKGMGLEAGEAGRVADVLTLASSRTNSSIGSLGESMKNLSPVAKQFGIGLEEAVGMVALLQDVGLDASEAGTATATMLTKLTKPAAGVAREMKRLGIAFQDAEGNMLPPLQIFEQMMHASDRLGGNMDQVAFFADLVGLRGQKAALNLKELFTSDRGQRLVTELQKMAGSSEKMAALRMKNLAGDWELFASAVEGLKIEIFNAVGKDLREIVTRAREWLELNKDWIRAGIIEAWQRLKTFVKEARVEVKTFIDENPKLMEQLRSVGRWISDNLPTLAKLGLAWVGITLAIKAASVALSIYNLVAGAFSAIMGGIMAAKWVIGWVKFLWAIAGGAAAAKATMIVLAKAVLLPLLAIGSLIAALHQLLQLLDEVGGMMGLIKGWFGGLKGGAKGLVTGKGAIGGFLEGFFEGVDEHMNEQARQRAAQEQRAAVTAQRASVARLTSAPDAWSALMPDLLGPLDLTHLRTTPILGSSLTQTMDELDLFEKQLEQLNLGAAEKYTAGIQDSIPQIGEGLTEESVRAALAFSETIAGSLGGATADLPPPEMTSAAMRANQDLMRTIREEKVLQSELLIRDPSRRTELRSPKGAGIRVTQHPSGSF